MRVNINWEIYSRMDLTPPKGLSALLSGDRRSVMELIFGSSQDFISSPLQLGDLLQDSSSQKPTNPLSLFADTENVGQAVSQADFMQEDFLG